MKTYLKIFIFITILIYIGCSIISDSWDPICWSIGVRKSIPLLLFVDLVASLLINILYSFIDE